MKSKMIGNLDNPVAVYTVLCILRDMRSELGLEAMLEYMGEYLGAIERSNPELKGAVARAMTLVSVGKMYRDAVK